MSAIIIDTAQHTTLATDDSNPPRQSSQAEQRRDVSVSSPSIRHDSASRSERAVSNDADTGVAFDEWSKTSDRIAKVQCMIDSPDGTATHKLAKLFGEYISTPRPESDWTADIFTIVEMLQDAKLFEKVKSEPNYPIIFDTLVLNRVTKADRQMQKTQCYLNRVTSIPGWANFPNDLPPRMRGHKIGEKTMQVIARLAERRGATYEKVIALLRAHCADGTQHLTVGKAQAAVGAADENPLLLVDDLRPASPPPPSRSLKRAGSGANDEPAPKRIETCHTTFAITPGPALLMHAKQRQGSIPSIDTCTNSSSEITAGHGLLTLSNFRAYNDYPTPTRSFSPAASTTTTAPTFDNDAIIGGSTTPGPVRIAPTLAKVTCDAQEDTTSTISRPSTCTDPGSAPGQANMSDLVVQLTRQSAKIEELQQSLVAQVRRVRQAISTTRAELDAKHTARTAFSEQIDRQKAASDVNQRMVSDGSMAADMYQELSSGLDSQAGVYRQARAKVDGEIRHLDDRLAMYTRQLDRADLAMTLTESIESLTNSTAALKTLTRHDEIETNETR